MKANTSHYCSSNIISDWKEIYNDKYKKINNTKYELLWCHYICLFLLKQLHKMVGISESSEFTSSIISNFTKQEISLNKRWMRQWQHANSSKDAHSWHGMNMWCTTSSQGPFWPNKKTSRIWMADLTLLGTKVILGTKLRDVLFRQK